MTDHRSDLDSGLYILVNLITVLQTKTKTQNLHQHPTLKLKKPTKEYTPRSHLLVNLWYALQNRFP